MAKIKVDQLEEGEPTVLAFELDEVQMEQLNILCFFSERKRLLNY